MTSFIGWGDAWGNSWGSAIDPNAMHGSASFTITGVLTVNAGEMVGSASMSFSGMLTLPTRPSGDVYSKPRRKYFVRKNGKIYLFNSGEEADLFNEANHKAELLALAKTSRRARKRVRDAIIPDFHPQVLDLKITEYLSQKFDMVHIPSLIEAQDWDRLLYIQNLAIEMEEEEDAALLISLP